MTADSSSQSNHRFQSELCSLLPELRRKALALTRNSSSADDLLQDTLERALRYQSQFNPGSHLRAWAFRIMTNRFISQRRRSATERRVLERTLVDPNGWARREPVRLLPGLSPPVDRAVGELPPRLRDAVLVVDLQGGSYKDASELMEVPLGTVMSRLSRGRARLRRELSAPERAAADQAAA